MRLSRATCETYPVERWASRKRAAQVRAEWGFDLDLDRHSTCRRTVRSDGRCPQLHVKAPPTIRRRRKMETLSARTSDWQRPTFRGSAAPPESWLSDRSATSVFASGQSRLLKTNREHRQQRRSTGMNGRRSCSEASRLLRGEKEEPSPVIIFFVVRQPWQGVLIQLESRGQRRKTLRLQTR